MSRGWVVTIIGVGLLILLVTTAIFSRFREAPLPDENDGTWIFKDEVKSYTGDREGKEFLFQHTRIYKDSDGKLTLEIHEVFGKVIWKMWQNQNIHMTALLDDNGKWHISQISGPEIFHVHKGGELRAVRFILRNANGCIVAKRLVGRQQQPAN